jgi:hypothetical protein
LPKTCARHLCIFVSGALRPGQATDVTAEQLDQELLNNSSSTDAPILVT